MSRRPITRKETTVITRGLALALLGILVLGWPAVTGAQSLSAVPYDAFNAVLLDPLRWRGQESFKTDTLGVRNTEITRRVVSGQAELFMRTFGSAGLDTGSSGAARLRMLINHPALLDGTPAITALQARVTVTSVEADDCAANTTETRSRVQVYGFFFNDGTANATPGDLNGDILAGVLLERNTKLGDRIGAFISRCDEASCGNATPLKSVVFGRVWTVNAPETVTVRWRKSRKDFEFTAASAAGTETHVLPYGDILLFDSELPKQNGNFSNQGLFVTPIGVQNNIANCAAGPLGASIGARFDNIKLNQEAMAALP